MNLQIFIPPLIGAVIGYITNDIAIKMLFHPRKAIFIGKWQMPFTPGLIPKEKDRIAKSVGNVVSTQLLNPETFTAALVSEEMLVKVRTGMECFIDCNRDNTATIEDALLRLVSEENMEGVVDGIKLKLSELIYRKLTSVEFGESISRSILTKLREKLNGFTFGMFVNVVDDSMTDFIAKSVGELINSLIADNAKDIINDLIGTEMDKIMEMPINEFIRKYEDKLPNLMASLTAGYKALIENYLPDILRIVDLSKVVEEKISSFSVEELENMIFGIMKKELNAIVYLGAALGFIMGWLNLLVGI